MAPQPVGPPPGFFDDDPEPRRPKEDITGSLLLALGILAVSLFLGIRSCVTETSPARPGGSP